MNVKHLGIIALTAVIIAIAWKVSENKAPQTEVARNALYPDLLTQLNDVSRVQFRAVGSETTLVRNGDAWQIENKDQFAANAGAVKRTLLQVANLRTIEAKTRSAKHYAKLGVSDLDSEGAEGTLVTVTASGDKQLFELIVGHARGTGAQDQYYVRRMNDEQTWLVEGALEVPADPIRWLDAAIVDIDTQRVREVRITTPDGSPITITKREQNDNFFSLQDVPAGFEAQSKTTVSSIGALLLDLRFNDVESASRVASLEPVRHVDVTTFDGLIASLDEFAVDDKTFVRFGFKYDESAALAPAKPETESLSDEGGINEIPSDAEPLEEGAEDADADDNESVADEANRLAASTAKWVYVLPNYKQRMFQRDFDSLIKAQETEE